MRSNQTENAGPILGTDRSADERDQQERENQRIGPIKYLSLSLEPDREMVPVGGHATTHRAPERLLG